MMRSASVGTLGPPVAPARPSAFRRFAPTVATIIVVVACVAAGNWQYARMQYKAGLQAQYNAAIAAPPLRAHELPAAGADPSALRYREVLLDGTFDPRRQFLLDNRVHEGRPGYDVVTPFVLADGRTLLVDRGWVALGRSRADIPSLPPPAGTVTLRGRIDLPPRTWLGRESDANPAFRWPAVWQHLDLQRFATLSGVTPMPFFVQQTGPVVAGDDLLRTMPAPDFGIDTHRIYMVQWYAFALVALVFWAVTHLRPRRGRSS